jgi:lysophospholipase L1-like esterase
MRHPALALLAVALILPSALFPAGENLAQPLPGYAPYPALSAAGDLVVLFRDRADRLALTGFRGDRPSFSVRAISGRLLTDAAVLKRDGAGGLWAAWAEEVSGAGAIRLARVAERRMEIRRIAGIGADFPVSVDLAFDAAGRPWLAAILHSDAGYAVRIYPPDGARPLTIAGSDAEIACVRLAPSPGRMFALWIRCEGGRGEIFSAPIFENGSDRNAPSAVVRSSDGPIQWLQAAGAPGASPWIVWSVFDGEDYEVRAARLTEAGAAPGDAVTENRDQDIFPSLAFLASGEPLVVWHRPAAEGGRIVARRLTERGWGRELFLAPTAAPLRRPPLAVAGGRRLALAWEEADSVRTARFDLADLSSFPSPPLASGASLRPRTPLGADPDDSYLAFGDSITYGVIDNQYVPERGYIPRLETLLRDRFGAASIVNEGWPGEITVNGMGRMGAVLAAHPIGTLLLMEGTNDIIFSEFAMASTAFHIERMIAAAREAGAYTVMATIIPRSDWRWGLKFYRDRIFDLNDRLRALARNLRLPLAEQFDAFYGYPEADGGWRALLSDKVHPTDKGYEIMSLAWFGEVSRLPFRPVAPAVERTVRRSLLLAQPVNVVSWAPNPRQFDLIILIGYNLYRSEDAPTAGEPGFLAFLPASGAIAPAYVDASIDPSRHYRYRIRAVRRDGVEGPPSDIVHD